MNADDLEAAFMAFDADNPGVFELFVRFAREARLAGHEKFSAYMIANRIRWESAITTRGDEFKLNNNFIPYYARAVEAAHPELRGFFRLRTAAADLMLPA